MDCAQPASDLVEAHARYAVERGVERRLGVVGIEVEAQRIVAASIVDRRIFVDEADDGTVCSEADEISAGVEASQQLGRSEASEVGSGRRKQRVVEQSAEGWWYAVVGMQGV